MTTKPIELIAVKSRSGVYIADATWLPGYWNRRVNIDMLLFDGKAATATKLKDWGRIDAVPTAIDRVIPATSINYRYELKEGCPVTEQTPVVLTSSEVEDRGVRGLYDLKSDPVPERTEPLEFQLAVLDEDSDFEPVEPPFPVQNSLLDMLRIHPVLLPMKAVRATEEESYKLIRQHVIENINPKVAAITSNYDFCFTVKKLIPLAEVETYVVDVANSIFQKRARKPKMETRYRKHRDRIVYEVAPKPYQKYPVVRCFTGTDLADLQHNVKVFLDDLMTMINEPFKDCPHCKGMGVVLSDGGSQ